MRLKLFYIFALSILFGAAAVDAQDRPPEPGSQSTTLAPMKRKLCAPTEKDYPVASLRAGEQGATRLAFKVSGVGELLSVSVLRSSGFPRLDHAAEQVLRTCVLPIKKDTNGLPVEASYAAEFVWRLE